jgi:hypothetical protein
MKNFNFNDMLCGNNGTRQFYSKKMYIKKCDRVNGYQFYKVYSFDRLVAVLRVKKGIFIDDYFVDMARTYVNCTPATARQLHQLFDTLATRYITACAMCGGDMQQVYDTFVEHSKYGF